MADPTPTRVKLNTLQMMIIFFLLPYICSGAETSTTVQSMPEKSVGFLGFCNATLKCNNNLICSNGSCKCNQESMAYETETQRCVVQDKNSCVAGGSSSNASLSTILPCSKRSKCDSLKGICVPIESSIGLCTTSSDCRQGAGLVCENNLCICDPNTTIQDTSGSCLGKADKPCVNNKCASNANCVDHPDLNNHDAPINKGLPENKETSSYKHVCKCIEGHYPTPSGVCAKDYGIVCGKERPCQPWLTCGAAGSCECRDPTTQVFDEERASCVAKVNGDCTANFTGDEYDRVNQTICVLGGECVKNSYYVGGKRVSIFEYHCECKSGFVRNDEGTCDLVYGSRCKDDEEQLTNLKCERKRKLACIKGKCMCEEPLHAYDDTKGECVGLAGAICNVSDPTYHDGTPVNSAVASGTRGQSMEEGSPGCTKGAKCERVQSGVLGSQGVCKCIQDQQVGGTCDNGTFLNSQEFLLIIAGVGAAVGVALLLGCVYLRKQGFVVNNAFH